MRGGVVGVYGDEKEKVASLPIVFNESLVAHGQTQIFGRLVPFSETHIVPSRTPGLGLVDKYRH